MIPYGKQQISIEDIDRVITVLKSPWLTQGPNVSQFEKAISTYVNCQYGVAVNSATSALHIACLALGVQAGDTVWTSPNTFVASANCARYCGANVDFIDIDINTGNICLRSLEKQLIIAEKEQRLPKVIIPVHFAGQSCDMSTLWKLSKEYNFKIIEDASHALGGEYLNKKVGCCQFSDITVFSFHPVKMITTGEGGMALTNSECLYNKLKLFGNHGITKDPQMMKKTVEEPWYYEQQCLGYNYRLADINAALGLSQLKYLDEWVNARNSIAQQYIKAFKGKVEMLEETKCSLSSFHLFVIKVPVDKRLAIFKGLKKAGIGAQVHYIPVYNQPDFTDDYNPCPNVELYYKQCISIPIYPSLDNETQTFIINKVLELIN